MVLGFCTLQAEATFSLCELACEKWPLPTTVQICPEIWMNKLKNGFFPVLDRFRALREKRESSVADQSCCNFFILMKLAPIDDGPDD